MRTETIVSARRLRILGKISLVFGVLSGLFILISKLYILLKYSIEATSVVSCLINSFSAIFAGYVGLVIFDAIATTVENLDKTELISAIDRNSLSNLDDENDELKNYINHFSKAYEK